MATAGLELRGIRKSYGTLVAVNDLDMAVRPGEVFVLPAPLLPIHHGTRRRTIDLWPWSEVPEHTRD
jgi:hypothetical protein